MRQTTLRTSSARRSSAPRFGLVVFGVGLIVTSLLQMTALSDADHYGYLFQDLPPWAIMSRYVVSWMARFVGLAAGVGILRRQELFRKTTLVLAWGTAITAYWKHPYAGFVRHISDLELRSSEFKMLIDQILQQAGMSLSTLTRIIVMVVRAQEIAFALLLIWYFSLPRVKAQFAPSSRRA